ncbi:RagB/SusD family nutrient uptake outer membrane protein [Mariniflexile sp. AS56]|uniref:RagB/SusD family nutrient uptake outer membrane protein n=1 Tax=Mariniflexile sp. AS56 TaxID=3063957 RepID=UPI0026F07523|nr:RagB/SusD family nutrient uptake outer membrane protein [Mariniflexile sp. AS56]MDO7173280.1 RagB/SusD family nutrient uptake outer membrane protein [Mariniflexile sp. AS56]
MKYLKYIAIILIGNVFVSCSDFLEPVPGSSITTDNYYTTAEELETGLIGVYAAIKGINSNDKDENHGVQWEFYVTEMRSDNTSTKSPDSEDASDAGQLESLNVLPTNNFVNNYYTSFFQVISRANVILANLDVVEDSAKAKAIEGEAKFLRAYAYFNLVRLFGDLPLIDRIIAPSETEIQFTRVGTNSIYELIVADLETAVSGLNNTYTTRASKPAAQALLAKVYLTMATPGSYLKAQLLCEEIINSTKYSLKSNFHDVFYTERNSEIIFAIGYNSGVQDNSQIFSAEWMNAVGNTSGVNYVTTNAVAAIDTYGGSRISDSYRPDPLTLFGGTIRYQVTKYFPDGASGGSDGQTFTGLPQLAGNDWIVLRYADVLLMRAEAILAGAIETSNGNAIDSYMQVRVRAGFNAVTDRPSKLTKEALLIERRVEFAFENQRMFDLIRFGAAQSVLSVFADANGFNFASTDLLLPIPQNEINLSRSSSTLMTQNPGYN